MYNSFVHFHFCTFISVPWHIPLCGFEFDSKLLFGSLIIIINNYFFVVSSQCFNTFDQFHFHFQTSKFRIYQFTPLIACGWGVRLRSECALHLKCRCVQCAWVVAHGTWILLLLLVGLLSFQHKLLLNEPPIPNYFIHFIVHISMWIVNIYDPIKCHSKNISMHIHI